MFLSSTTLLTGSGAYLSNGTLNKHCAETEAKAEARLAELIDSMAKAEGVTEALKAKDPMKWVGRMNSIRSRTDNTDTTRNHN